MRNEVGRGVTEMDAAGDTVGAVPYVMERYGIIYNKKLLQKYFDSSWASIKSVDSINNFKTTEDSCR